MCLTPWCKRDKDAGANYMLPCGKCPDCASRRASGWAFRLQLEELHASSAHFVTLTYEEKNIIYTAANLQTLYKKDVQDWMKKLRKRHAQKIKYYAVGEYGGDFQRPHYHLILFNARPDLVIETWDKGGVYFGSVTGGSVAYTLKYISNQKTVPAFAGDDRLPEFSLMSKGLGEVYLTPEAIRWHKKDLEQRMYINIEGGKKVAMPRYFKDKIYDELERAVIASSHVARYGLELEKMEADPEFEQNQKIFEQRVLAAFRKQKRSQKTMAK